MKTRRERMIDGCAAYAASDKSDPFAFSRAVSHTLSGVASIDGDRDNFYSAERYAEQRVLPTTGETYAVEAYKNATRP